MFPIPARKPVTKPKAAPRTLWLPTLKCRDRTAPSATGTNPSVKMTWFIHGEMWVTATLEKTPHVPKKRTDRPEYKSHLDATEKLRPCRENSATAQLPQVDRA